ncbi:YcgL domain-containing protein [Marinimicrobium sp. ABcell2]|uniref:YcgL domain-containing protein n=1 Tax=Marinimicrobium sp. ABcell2 TaxID=3069751 RepID=UPI0027AF0CD6|nr:YcgL domain-containing protein [Marinimicrobium sp. ABcell2]MDQ2077948.1 YcgL domain-containing protein [Marinimicrobium sp. ABcell2]
MTEKKIICQIYRSPREEGMYLYVTKEEGLERVPEELLKRFGTPQPAMVLLLTPERKLARVPVERVMASLEEPGYYLQLPPRGPHDTEQQLIHQHNSKL